MGLNWINGYFRDERFRVWAPKTDKPGLVGFLSGQNGIVSHDVHFVRELKRSVPCLGDGCPYHPGQVDTKSYAPIVLFLGDVVYRKGQRETGWQDQFELPASAFLYRSELWSPRILEITSTNRQLILRACHGLLVFMHRPGVRANGAAGASIIPRPLQDLPEDLCFDPRPFLAKTWGLARVPENV